MAQLQNILCNTFLESYKGEEEQSYACRWGPGHLYAFEIIPNTRCVRGRVSDNQCLSCGERKIFSS